MERRLWTREELILALNLYLKLPFGKLHHGNPEIIHLAYILNRTPNSIAMRLSNFASVDPFHQGRGIKGLRGGIKQVGPIWNEFINNKEDLLFESENILAGLEKQSIETKFADVLLGIENFKGETKLREVKTRVIKTFSVKLFLLITIENVLLPALICLIYWWQAILFLGLRMRMNDSILKMEFAFRHYMTGLTTRA